MFLLAERDSKAVMSSIARNRKMSLITILLNYTERKEGTLAFGRILFLVTVSF